MLVTVGGVAARGYYSYADAFLSASASNDVASPALTDKQVVKTTLISRARGLSLTTEVRLDSCPLNKAEPGIGDKHSKCELLESYVKPAEG